MSESKQTNISKEKEKGLMGKNISRKDFFKYTGGAAVAATTIGVVGCDNDNNPVMGNEVMISSINPTMAPPGTKVTIKGMNFSSTASQDVVRFGSKKAPVVSASTTKLVVKVPQGLTMGQKYTVTVTVNGSTATAPKKFTVSETTKTVDLGSGDVGVLNYAYALEQLEAAFYIKVNKNPYDGMSSDESKILGDIKDHEIAHKAFYHAAIPKSSQIPALHVDFSAVDFSSRTSVLKTALTFENVGVSAYNGAASKLKKPEYLLAAGKIVSVEARHSSAISDLVRPDAGIAGNQLVNADKPIINSSGLGLHRNVAEVYGIVNPYIVEKLDASGIVS